ncbi:MAG: pantetheine-phosphate adenylyltransferase, partial [Longimicrobiales bacterium]|nr:pantetheine-phosphate adenylyltransferase [Longimicrobiales bacterium]
HEDIARRALRVADRVIIAVAHTSTHQKSGLFDVDERVTLIRSVFDDEPRVEVLSFTGLLVDLARDQGAHLVIRGLRAVSDFEYELQMAQMNQELNPDLETLFLVPEVNNSFISSSLVRQVAALGGDVSTFVSRHVLDGLMEKLRG